MQVAGSRSFVGGLVAAAALLGSVGAQANLVANGDFETGNFDGWTQTNLDPVFDTVFNGVPQSGAFAASMGNVLGVSVLSQTLATVAGATYDITFYLANETDVNGDTAPNSFEFDWDGSAIDAQTDAGAFGYTPFHYLLTASSASTEIAFRFNQTKAFWDFDTVDAHVPEPGSFALAGLAGLLALAAGRRRSPRLQRLPAAG